MDRQGPLQLSARELGTAAGICLVLSMLFLSPALLQLRNWGIQDWDQHAFYHEAARVSMLEYGQSPQWNPYYCGGTDLLANPQSRVLSPTFLIILLFGSPIGLKLELVLFSALGMLGFYLLSRQQGLDRVCAWIGPLVYFLGPFSALPSSTGMTWAMSIAYLPWALFFYFRSFVDGRAVAGTGACLALMYLGGGVYPLVVTLAFLGFHALLVVREHGLRRSALALGGSVALTAVLGAAKFLPSVEFMREFPRHMEQRSGFSLQSLYTGLFAHDQRLEVLKIRFDGSHFDRADRLLRGISTEYDDVGMYIGPLVAGLFVLGCALQARRQWRWLVTLGVFLWLSLGERPALSLFALLHRLPVYESMRYSERFRLIWFLVLCLFAGHGLQWLRQRLRERQPAGRLHLIVPLALLAVVAIDTFVVTRPIYAPAFSVPPLRLPRSPEFHQVRWLKNYDRHGFKNDVEPGVHSSWSAHLPALLMNLGAVKCYETAFVPRVPTPMTEPGYRGEVYLLGGRGEVRTAYWSPNQLRYAVRVDAPALLVVNQNFYPQWRATDGRRMTSYKGLLSTRVGPSDRVLELYYERTSFHLGAAISGLGWCALLLALWREQRRRRARRAPEA